MIDAILHSVEETEEKADQILKAAKQQALSILEGARREAEELRLSQKKALGMEADAGRKQVLSEEAVKDEDAKNAVLQETEAMKKNAKEKSDQIVAQLAAQII